MTPLQLGMIAAMQNLRRTGTLEKPEAFMNPKNEDKSKKKQRSKKA